MILNAIYARLSGSTGLTDVVDDRIYATYIPEGDVAPAIAYNAISNPQQTKSGYAFSEDSVEIMCLSRTYDQGASLAQIIVGLFIPFGYNKDGVVVQNSKVDSITRGYNDQYKEYTFVINISFKSHIT